MDRSSSGTKIRGNRANGQFLDLRYLSARKGQPKHHYHPITPPFLSAVFVAEWRGWIQEQIAELVGLSQNRVSEIINNTIFGKIGNLLCQERDKVSFFQTTLTS